MTNNLPSPIFDFHSAELDAVVVPKEKHYEKTEENKYGGYLQGISRGVEDKPIV